MAKTARTVLELVTNIDEYISDLKKGEKSNAEFDKSVEKISKGFKDVGKDISSFGEGMSKYVTLPVVGAVAATGALIMSMADSGDAIAKNAREAGLSAEAYQELKFAVGSVGKLTEEQVDGAFRKLTQTIGDAAAGSDKAQVALQLLGYTQKEIESGSITTEDAFNKFNATMQDTASQSEAVAIAGELVGDKIGPSLAAALRTSGQEVGALRDKAKDLGLVMSQDALDASEAFKDEMGLLEKELGSVGRQIASDLLPIIMDDLIPFIRNEAIPRIRDFAEWLAGLAKGFSDLSPGMKLFISGGVAMVAAVGPVLVIVGKLITAFGVVLPAAISATNAAIAFFAANPVVMIVLGIAAAFYAVKVAADDSTAAIRRNISALADQKTIHDLFNKTTALTAEEHTRLWEALNRVEKQTHINSKGVGTLGASTTGLRLDVEELGLELDEHASPAMRRSKAEIERLKKEQEEAAKATKKHGEEVKTLAEGLSGSKLQEQVDKLTASWNLLTPAQQAAAVSSGRLAEAVKGLAEAGATLPKFAQDEVDRLKKNAKGWDEIFKTIRRNLDEQESRLDADQHAWEKWVTQQEEAADAADTAAADIEAANKKIARSGNTTAQSAMDDIDDWVEAQMTMPFVLKLSKEKFEEWLAFVEAQAEKARKAIRDSVHGDASAFGKITWNVSEAELAEFEKSGEKAGKESGDGLLGAFGRAIEGLGDVIVGAIMGGGDVGQAAGAHIGKSLGDELGVWLKQEIPGRLGKLIGGFAGPLSALAGQALGGLVDKLFGGNDTKKGREALARTLGFSSLAAMNADLSKMGADGARLVNEGLNKIGKTDTAANEAWIQSVRDLYKAKADAKVAEAEAAAAFNAEAQAMIPNWKTAGELAEKYGIDIAALGTKFQQGGLSEATQEIYTDFQRLAAFIGEDMNEGVLRGMSDEISGAAQKALKFGLEMPKQMQPIIAKLQEMGLLVDENGEKLEGVENLKFGETMQETTLSLIEAMKDLARVMRGDISDSIKGVKDVAKGVVKDMRGLFSEPIPITFDWDTDGAPSFYGGTVEGPGRSTLPAPIPMADGWYGRVFRPTTFIAGDKPGGEDVAFSGVGKSFRSNTERPIYIQNDLNVDGRRLTRVVNKYQPGSLVGAGVTG